MTPKVSIITPTFNHGKYIAKCIKSVLSQTFTDWEQIIVDDNSTDDTYKIASQFVIQDKRIKIIKHQKNWEAQSLDKTYNQALQLCNGEYVAILEGDDMWPRKKLSKQIDALEKTRAILSYGDCIFVSKIGLPIYLYTYNYDRKILNNEPPGAILNLFLELTKSIIPVTVIIRKDILTQIGGFQHDKNYPFTDIPTFAALSLKGRFIYQNSILGFYRKHDKSQWFEHVSNSKYMGKDKIKYCIDNLINKNQKSPTVKKIKNKLSTISSKYDTTLRKRFNEKKIRLLINKISFSNISILLTFVFIIQYIIYKVEKFAYENWN